MGFKIHKAQKYMLSGEPQWWCAYPASTCLMHLEEALVAVVVVTLVAVPVCLLLLALDTHLLLLLILIVFVQVWPYGEEVVKMRCDCMVVM